MKAVYALSLLAAAASALSFKTDSFWQSYKTTFNRKYSNEAEEARRYQVFTENMARAAEYNKMDSGAVYGMTSVSDRFPEEIRMAPVIPSRVERTHMPSVSLPDSYDARQDNIVPPIRNQGQCGSCWAFSGVATISTNYAKKHGGQPPILSEQQVVDCSTNDHGCSGGWPLNVFEYAKDKGLMLASDYPYSATTGTCKYDASKVYARASSYGYTDTTVDAMKTAIYNYGMISVALNADKMQTYVSGIISADGCSPSLIDHAVNAVGWGKQNGSEYWIIRNSWGTMWGESGYCRMVAGQNACGVESYPMYATAE